MTEWILVGTLAGCLIAAGVILLAVLLAWRRWFTTSQSCRSDVSLEQAEQLCEQMRDLIVEMKTLSERLNSHPRPQDPSTVAGTGQYQPALQTKEASNNIKQISTDVPQTLPEKHREILRLRRQGLDALEIARRTEMDVGQVELILNLHASSC